MAVYYGSHGHSGGHSSVQMHDPSSWENAQGGYMLCLMMVNPNCPQQKSPYASANNGFRYQQQQLDVNTWMSMQPETPQQGVWTSSKAPVSPSTSKLNPSAQPFVFNPEASSTSTGGNEGDAGKKEFRKIDRVDVPKADAASVKAQRQPWAVPQEQRNNPAEKKEGETRGRYAETNRRNEATRSKAQEETLRAKPLPSEADFPTLGKGLSGKSTVQSKQVKDDNKLHGTAWGKARRPEDTAEKPPVEQPGQNSVLACNHVKEEAPHSAITKKTDEEEPTPPTPPAALDKKNEDSACRALEGFAVKTGDHLSGPVEDESSGRLVPSEQCHEEVARTALAKSADEEEAKQRDEEDVGRAEEASKHMEETRENAEKNEANRIAEVSQRREDGDASRQTQVAEDVEGQMDEAANGVPDGGAVLENAVGVQEEKEEKSAKGAGVVAAKLGGFFGKASKKKNVVQPVCDATFSKSAPLEEERASEDEDCSTEAVTPEPQIEVESFAFTPEPQIEVEPFLQTGSYVELRSSLIHWRCTDEPLPNEFLSLTSREDPSGYKLETGSPSKHSDDASDRQLFGTKLKDRRGGDDRRDRDERRRARDDRRDDKDQADWRPPRESLAPPSANAYRRLFSNEKIDRPTELKRCVNSLLNKICPENIGCIARRIKDEAKVASVSELELTIALIFKKSITESHYIETYADLVFLLKSEMPEFPNPSLSGGKPVTFKSTLLNVCQTEFENMPRKLEASDEEKASMDPDELEFELMQQKKRFLANMKFIGNLFLRQLLSTKIISSIIEDLVMCDAVGTSAEIPQEPIVECICELLLSIGYTLEQFPAGKHALSQVCGRLTDLRSRTVKEGKKERGIYSKRIHFAIQDVLETRNANWQRKVFVQSAKTKEEVKKEQDRDIKAAESGKVVSTAEIVIAGQRPALLTPNDPSSNGNFQEVTHRSRVRH